MPQHLRNENLTSPRCFENPETFAGSGFGVVYRSQDPRLDFDELHHVFLVERMVSERETVGAGVQQQFCMCAGQTHAVACIFAVDHYEIEPPSIAQPRQILRDCGPSGPPHNITKKQNSHAIVLWCGLRKGKRDLIHQIVMTPDSVTTASSF